MKKIIPIIAILFSPLANSAQSAVVYPNFTGLSTATISGVSTPVATSGTVSNGVINFPRTYKVPGIPSAAQEAISKAATLSSPVAQSLAKKQIIGAIAGGVVGLGVTYLASLGLEYLADHWSSPSTQTWPDGTVNTGNSWSAGLNAAQFCTSAVGGASKPIMTGTANGYCSGNPNAWFTINSPTAPQRNPLTTQQAETYAQNSPIQPTDADIKMMLDAGWGVPVSKVPTVKIDLSKLNSQDLLDLQNMGYFQPTPDSLAIKNGQPILDPLTGESKQPMLQIDPAPNAGVRLTPYDTPVDAAGNPKLDAQGYPVPNQKAEVDPCELNPDRAGCIPLGDADQTNPTSTARTITGDFNSFNISGQCPADKTFSVAGMTQTIQMAPVCNAATNYIKPFLLLMASVTAYMIFVGGLRS